MIRTPNTCVICATPGLRRSWLQNHDAHEFQCDRCGSYVLDSALWSHLDDARAKPNQRVLDLMPHLRAAIQRYNSDGGEHPHFTLENWEAEAREFRS